MGNRLTLPLLLLAALLAGGAFFWMTGDGRGAGEPGRGPAAVEPAKAHAPAELAAPEQPRVSGDAAASTRVERTETEAPTPVSRPKTAESVALSGQVVDRFGTPVADARVTVGANGIALDLALERDFPWLKRQRTRTDADGRFRFDDVEPGNLQVSVRASGFAPFEQRGIAVPRADTTLDPMVLARGAILSGQVVAPDGRPVAGARIVPSDLSESGGLFLIGDREPSAVTGADGHFRIDELACGPWRFLVASEDHPDLTVEGQADEPGVEVSGLRWELLPGATIAGTVTGIPSDERGQLEVRAVKAGSQGLFGLGGGRVAKVEANGAFQLRGLQVGEGYSLQARRQRLEEERAFWERSRSTSVKARAGDSGVLLAYQPEAAVLFTVFDAATRAPIENFQVESGIDWPGPLLDDAGRARKSFPGGVARVGGLRPGSDQDRVQLRIHATGYEDFERSDIALRAGQEIDLGAIYLSPVPTLRVHVTDQRTGAPVADATVRMQKEHGDAFQIRHSVTIGSDEAGDTVEIGESQTAKTDAEGWAELTSFEGATVDITARADGFAPGKLPSLALPNGQPPVQELRLTRGGEVLVQVLDADDHVLPGARVEHRADSETGGGVFVIGGHRGAGEISDSEGRVVFENLAPGLHSFRISEGDGGGPVFASMDTVVIAAGDQDEGEDWSRVQVEEGGRAELTLRAAPQAGLGGRVREAGKVLAGATLRLEKESSGSGGARRMMFPGMGGGGREASSDGEGRYRFDGVKEGRYTLTVEHPTRRMPQEFALELREGENSFDVDLPLTILSGRVADAKGEPLSGVRVWAERREAGGGRNVRMAMVMINDDGGGGVIDSGQFGERAMTDADGRYSLRGVLSDVDLVVKAEGDTVQPGESEGLRLAPNQVKEHVDLVLDPAGSIHVEASLSDGAPARFQLVRAEYLGESDPAPQPKFGFLQQGSTELKGLRPGRWKINVRDASENVQGGGQDKEVEVVAGETATLSFEVE